MSTDSQPQIQSVSGEVPRRPILVVEYPNGMSCLDGSEEWIDNVEIARRLMEAIQKQNESGCGVAIPVAIPAEIDVGCADGKLIRSWSLLKSPGWSVYQLLPPKEELDVQKTA
jgi:hypothetical protein